jgi:hypothetical protein
MTLLRRWERTNSSTPLLLRGVELGGDDGGGFFAGRVGDAGVGYEADGVGAYGAGENVLAAEGGAESGCIGVVFYGEDDDICLDGFEIDGGVGAGGYGMG